MGEQRDGKMFWFVAFDNVSWYVSLFARAGAQKVPAGTLLSDNAI